MVLPVLFSQHGTEAPHTVVNPRSGNDVLVGQHAPPTFGHKDPVNMERRNGMTTTAVIMVAVIGQAYCPVLC